MKEHNYIYRMCKHVAAALGLSKQSKNTDKSDKLQAQERVVKNKPVLVQPTKRVELHCSDGFFAKKYIGIYPEVVLYAEMPESGNHLIAQFADCAVNIENLKISNSFAGILEGNPSYISMSVFEDEAERALNDPEKDVKVLFPKWKTDSRDPLPPYRYEINMKYYVPKENPSFSHESDWYFLKLIWFGDAPSEGQSISSYINSITSQLEYLKIARLIPEEEKSW